MPPLLRTILLLAAGAALLAVEQVYVRTNLPDGFYPLVLPPQWAARIVFVLLAVVLCAEQTIGSWLARQVRRLRGTGPLQRLILAFVVCLIAILVLVIDDRQHRRPASPRVHDEHSMLIQARMLARLRLWMPRHEQAEFFETFHVFVEPVYASMYFPGNALLYVPGTWLHLPDRATSLLAAGLAVTVLFLVVTELADAVAGILAATALLGTLVFRILASTFLAQVPMMLAALLLVWAWLRWRQAPTRWRSLLVGAAAGWGLIIRPVDGLAYVIPVGLLILIDLVRPPRRPAPHVPRGVAQSLGFMALGAIPLLSLQLLANKGITGSWTTTPFTAYLDRFHPRSGLGVRTYDPAARPQTALQQKLDFYFEWMVPMMRRHQPGVVLEWWFRERLPLFLRSTVPPALLLFGPAGLLLLDDRRRWWAVAAPLILLGVYAFYPFVLWHYSIVLAPAVLLIGTLGVKHVTDRLFDLNYPRLATLVPVLTAAILIGGLPMWTFRGGRDRAPLPDLRGLHERLDRAIRGRALVFFQYGPGADYHAEPVYNYQDAWPDHARIVKAQSLGQRNGELIEYYARRQPDRQVYVFDRVTGQLRHLGRADELAKP